MQFVVLFHIVRLRPEEIELQAHGYQHEDAQ